MKRLLEGSDDRGGFAPSSRAMKRSTAAALAAALSGLTLGAATASADPKTGFVLEVTCGSETTTIISPSAPAAVGHDIESTDVFVVAVAAIEAPAGRFPVGKVMLCDFKDLTTGGTREDVPFLVRGAP